MSETKRVSDTRTRRILMISVVGLAASVLASLALPGTADAGAAGMGGAQVRVRQIRASGRGDPKQIPSDLKALRSTLSKFAYRDFQVVEDEIQRKGYGQKMRFVLASGDVLTIQVHNTGGKLHVKAEVTRGPKLRMRTTISIRSGRTTIIAQDLGTGGEGLFIALTVSGN